MNELVEERVFQSNGMLWNTGDIPSCDYCGSDFDNVSTLHETPFSGGLCCENDECRDSLLNDVLYNQVEENL